MTLDKGRATRNNCNVAVDNCYISNMFSLLRHAQTTARIFDIIASCQIDRRQENLENERILSGAGRTFETREPSLFAHKSIYNSYNDIVTLILPISSPTSSVARRHSLAQRSISEWKVSSMKGNISPSRILNLYRVPGEDEFNLAMNTECGLINGSWKRPSAATVEAGKPTTRGEREKERDCDILLSPKTVPWKCRRPASEYPEKRR